MLQLQTNNYFTRNKGNKPHLTKQVKTFYFCNCLLITASGRSSSWSGKLKPDACWWFAAGLD
jgi:hypothetical protein